MKKGAHHFCLQFEDQGEIIKISLFSMSYIGLPAMILSHFDKFLKVRIIQAAR